MAQDEVFDIFDSRMRRTGTASRKEAHAQGLWHQTFHCWVIRTPTRPEEDWSLLLQLRHRDKDTFPNMLDISCAGHLLAGERVEDGVRELQEELGLSVAFAELISCGVFAEEDIISETLIDREFCHVFLYPCNQALEAYKFQLSEVSGLFFIPLAAFQELVSGRCDSVLTKGVIVTDEAAGTTIEISRDVRKADIVPHPQAYYELLFHQISRLIAT